MSYTQLSARITDQRLELYNLPLLASGGVEEIMIRCEFCELWDGYGKTAVFYRKGGPVYHAAVYETDITVPWEVMTDPGVVFFGIMGEGENTRTTEVVRLTVEQGAITTATATPKEPTPDIYEQLLAAYGKAEKEYQMMQARVDNMVAARPGGGQHDYEAQDGTVSVEIYSNGAVAEIAYSTINSGKILQPGEYYECTDIVAEFAPLYPVDLFCSNSNLTVSYIQRVTVPGLNQPAQYFPILQIYNASSSPITLNDQHGNGTFALREMQIPELQDARVDVNGNAHDSAGAAIRDQVANASASPEQVQEAVEAYLDEHPVEPVSDEHINSLIDAKMGTTFDEIDTLLGGDS